MNLNHTDDFNMKSTFCTPEAQFSKTRLHPYYMDKNAAF
jgi:hypothetical protein